jgi:hypothetical protein
VAQSRPRPGLVYRLILGAFFVSLAALPLAHHDLVCHLKSPTHCGTCHIGTSTDDGGMQPAVGHVDLPDAGQAVEIHASAVSSCALSPSAGRSPPPAGIAIA